MGHASSAEKKFPHVWSISTLCTLGLGKTSTRCWISSAILVYHRPTLTHFSSEFTHEKLPDPTVDGSQTHLEKPVGMITKLWFPLVSLVFLCFSSNIHHCISWWLVTQPLKLVGPPSSLSRGFIGRERQNGRARCHGTVVPWQYCERQTAVRKGEFIECLKDFPSCYKLNTGHSIKTWWLGVCFMTQRRLLTSTTQCVRVVLWRMIGFDEHRCWGSFHADSNCSTHL